MTKFCTKCGASVQAGAAFCSKCGTQTKGVQPQTMEGVVKGSKLMRNVLITFVSVAVLLAAAVGAFFLTRGGNNGNIYIAGIEPGDYTQWSEQQPTDTQSDSTHDAADDTFADYSFEPEQQTTDTQNETAPVIAEGPFADDIPVLQMRSTQMLENVGGTYVFRQLLHGVPGLPLYFNYNAVTQDIFPGAIIRGDTLFSDIYTLVGINRAPISISIAGNSLLVDNPNFTNVTAARNQLVSNLTAPHVSSDFYMRRVEQGQAFSAGLNAGFAAGGIGITAGTETRTREFSTNMVVVVTQVFYTVTTEHPGSSGRFFTQNMSASDFGYYAPAFISSVNYGRIGVLTVSTNESESVTRSSLSAAIPIKKLGGRLSGSITAEQERVFNGLQIQGQIIGGGQGVMNADTFFAYFAAPPNIQNAVPLSFTLNRLDNNAPVEVVSILNENWLSESAVVFEIEFVDMIRGDYVHAEHAVFSGQFTFNAMDVIHVHREEVVGINRAFHPNRNIFILDHVRDVSSMEIRILRANPVRVGPRRGEFDFYNHRFPFNSQRLNDFMGREELRYPLLWNWGRTFRIETVWTFTPVSEWSG